MLSQEPSVVAVQVHSRAAETVIRADPPCGGMLSGAFSVTLQRVMLVVGDVMLVDVDDPQADTVRQAARAAARNPRARNVRIGWRLWSGFQRRHCQEPCHIRVDRTAARPWIR
jgi:hypothetical protein